MSDYSITLGGAVTVVNGIGLGIGSAIGTAPEHIISLETITGIDIETSHGTDHQLISFCIKLFENTYDVTIDNIKIRTELQVPPARGMKTSSIVSSGVIYLLGQYYGINQTIDEILKLGAQASINAGVSITGAIDDAYAVFEGGFVVTDNHNMKKLATHKIDIDKSVIFLIPKKMNPKSTISLNLNFLDSYVLEQAIEEAKEGNWKSAIEKNSKVYGKFFLEDFEIIYELENKLRGVIGLNGAGPSLFVICDEEDIDNNSNIIKQEFPAFELHISTMRFKT